MDRDGQLPVEEAVRIAGRVADALDYAHRHEVTPSRSMVRGVPDLALSANGTLLYGSGYPTDVSSELGGFHLLVLPEVSRLCGALHSRVISTMAASTQALTLIPAASASMVAARWASGVGWTQTSPR